MASNYQQPAARSESQEAAPEPAPAPEPATPEQQQAPTHINLKFQDQHGGELQFKLKTTTVLKKAMEAFSARMQRDRRTLRFLSPDGQRILDHQTPEMLELEDGDTIDVHMEQTGGGWA